MMGAYFRGRLFDNFPDRMGAYSSGVLIRGCAYSRIYDRIIDFRAMQAFSYYQQRCVTNSV